MKKKLKVGSLVAVYMHFDTHDQYGLGIVRPWAENPKKMFVEFIPSFPGSVSGRRDIKGDEEVLWEDFNLEKPSADLFRIITNLVLRRRGLAEKNEEIAKVTEAARRLFD